MEIRGNLSVSGARRPGWPWTKETDPKIYECLSSWPKISIITPSYNQGQFIEETIRSVVLQNYPNLEYIIIDGGSTDNTVEVIKRYEKWITYWVSEKDNGQSEAINKGFEKCTGEVVAWLNSDDWYEDGCLFEIGRGFNNSSVQIVNGNCRFFFEDDHDKDFNLEYGLVNEKRLLVYWGHKRHANPPQPSVFIRKSALDSVGGILDTSLVYAMDYDLWLRLVSEYKFTYLNEVISNYRFHELSKSVSDGGFKKFYPEWHQVFLKHLSKKNFITKEYYITLLLIDKIYMKFRTIIKKIIYRK